MVHTKTFTFSAAGGNTGCGDPKVWFKGTPRFSLKLGPCWQCVPAFEKRSILSYFDITDITLLSTVRLKPKTLYHLIKPVIKYKDSPLCWHGNHHIKQEHDITQESRLHKKSNHGNWSVPVESATEQDGGQGAWLQFRFIN